MKTKAHKEIDVAELNARLRRWRERHNTPEKLAEAHRKVALERVAESMAFENQPVSIERLKTLLKTRPKTPSA